METQNGGDHQHELIRTPEDSAVCTICGLVVDSGVCDYAADNGEKGEDRYRAPPAYHLGAAKQLYGTYQAIFHFNERMAQLCLQEPTIPSDLWELIQNEFDWGDLERVYPDAKALTKEDVSKICGSIMVPGDLQEKYRSKKFKCNPLKNLKRFSEKWLTIKKKLGGDSPPPLHPNDIYYMQREFITILMPFNIFRHNTSCAGGRKCHKSASKCRHNLPNYNYIIFQLLRRRGKGDLYRSWLPQLRTPAKIKALDKLCEKIWDYLGWDFTPVFQRKKRKRKPPTKPFRKIKKRKISVAPAKLRRSPRLAQKYRFLKIK